MNEYKIISQYGKFKYPEHCKFPSSGEQFHEKWIVDWTNLLNNLIGKEDVNAIEVGTYHGSCAVWLLEKILTGKNSYLYTINPTTNEYIETNLKPYNNIYFMKDTSFNSLIKLISDGKKEFFDVVYIDGSHFSKYVLEDAVLSFPLLKIGGFLIFDDYEWGLHEGENLKPKVGIDAFLKAYEGHYKIINIGWQVYLQKVECKYDAKMVSDLDIAL